MNVHKKTNLYLCDFFFLFSNLGSIARVCLCQNQKQQKTTNDIIHTTRETVGLIKSTTLDIAFSSLFLSPTNIVDVAKLWS